MSLGFETKIKTEISPSFRKIPIRVLRKPSCFPAKDRTWMRDFTQSMGYTTNHRQAPPKPPLNIKGTTPVRNMDTEENFLFIEKNRVVLKYWIVGHYSNFFLQWHEYIVPEFRFLSGLPMGWPMCSLSLPMCWANVERLSSYPPKKQKYPGTSRTIVVVRPW